MDDGSDGDLLSGGSYCIHALCFLHLVQNRLLSRPFTTAGMLRRLETREDNELNASTVTRGSRRTDGGLRAELVRLPAFFDLPLNSNKACYPEGIRSCAKSLLYVLSVIRASLTRWRRWEDRMDDDVLDRCCWAGVSCCIPQPTFRFLTSYTIRKSSVPTSRATSHRIHYEPKPSMSSNASSA